MTKARDLANGGFGLVLVKPSTVVNGTDNGKGTVSFSAATSVSLNDVFNSTYTNYKLVLNINTPSNDTQTLLRLRVSNTDATGSDYTTAGDQITDGGARAPFGGAASFWYLLDMDAGNAGTFYNTAIDIYNPFATQRTTASATVANVSSAGTFKGGYTGWLHNVATSYTGFTLLPGTGTISGQVSVYGYNK
jgi:hypothetical protein